MNFDLEGHMCVTPAEVDALLRSNIPRLINEVLLPGTPMAFPAYSAYRRFLAHVAECLGVHPSCIVVRGSAKLGFSIAPRAEKLWVAAGADSDVDLAIIDPDHFHFLDAEVRRWERGAGFRGKVFHQRLKLRENRGFYCYRYMDLPDTALVQKYQEAMDAASAPAAPGCGRPVTAFFYRDWWSVYSRYEFDLRQVARGLRQGLPPGEAVPRARPT